MKNIMAYNQYIYKFWQNEYFTIHATMWYTMRHQEQLQAITYNTFANLCIWVIVMLSWLYYQRTLIYMTNYINQRNGVC